MTGAGLMSVPTVAMPSAVPHSWLTLKRGLPAASFSTTAATSSFWKPERPSLSVVVTMTWDEAGCSMGLSNLWPSRAWDVRLRAAHEARSHRVRGELDDNIGPLASDARANANDARLVSDREIC